MYFRAGIFLSVVIILGILVGAFVSRVGGPWSPKEEDSTPTSVAAVEASAAGSAIVAVPGGPTDTTVMPSVEASPSPSVSATPDTGAALTAQRLDELSEDWVEPTIDSLGILGLIALVLLGALVIGYLIWKLLRPQRQLIFQDLIDGTSDEGLLKVLPGMSRLAREWLQSDMQLFRENAKMLGRETAYTARAPLSMDVEDNAVGTLIDSITEILPTRFVSLGKLLKLVPVNMGTRVTCTLQRWGEVTNQPGITIQRESLGSKYDGTSYTFSQPANRKADAGDLPKIDIWKRIQRRLTCSYSAAPAALAGSEYRVLLRMAMFHLALELTKDEQIRTVSSYQLRPKRFYPRYWLGVGEIGVQQAKAEINNFVGVQYGWNSLTEETTPYAAYLEWSNARSEKAFAEAIRLMPNWYLPHANLATLLSFIGREAGGEENSARQASSVRRYDQAIDLIRKDKNYAAQTVLRTGLEVDRTTSRILNPSEIHTLECLSSRLNRLQEKLDKYSIDDGVAYHSLACAYSVLSKAYAQRQTNETSASSSASASTPEGAALNLARTCLVYGLTLNYRWADWSEGDPDLAALRDADSGQWTRFKRALDTEVGTADNATAVAEDDAKLDKARQRIRTACGWPGA